MSNRDLQKKAESIICEQEITNLDLIHYFARSSKHHPIFLGSIHRNYMEIRALLSAGLLHDLDPNPSYVFYIDKLENYIHERYNEKIETLHQKIKKLKQEKNDLIQQAESMEPKSGCENYDEKLKECLEFTKSSVKKAQQIESTISKIEKEIISINTSMKKDPFYKFLFLIRNDDNVEFNKRVKDTKPSIKLTLKRLFNKSKNPTTRLTLSQLETKGIFHFFSQAKRYHLSQLGKVVCNELKRNRTCEEFDFTHVKDLKAEEITQEEEFSKLREEFGF